MGGFEDDTNIPSVSSRQPQQKVDKLGLPHLVKVGIFGQIGRFVSPDGRRYSRGKSVICRTDRGLEIGSILCDSPMETKGQPAPDGELLRPVSKDDQLIVDRIERFRNRAFNACENLLRQRGKSSILVDVEHLFDGQSLYFYFLGDVPEDVHQLTEELANEYEKKVGFRKFTEVLANGCGPNCGTEDSKCSSGGCSSCSLRGACKT